MEKALLMVLFPFFTVILLVGFVAFHTRGGRPIKLTLKGLGISFELNSICDPKTQSTPCSHADKI